MQRKYFINTYGCQMNVHESEKLAGILISRGYSEAQVIEDADIVVFNTCCVRETAEQRVLGNLGIVKKLRESKPQLKVAVCGCMAQKKGSAESLKKRCPFINIIFGTHNIANLPKLIFERTTTNNKVVEVSNLSTYYSLDNLAKAVDDSIKGNVFKAYIEI